MPVFMLIFRRSCLAPRSSLHGRENSTCSTGGPSLQVRFVEDLQGHQEEFFDGVSPLGIRYGLSSMMIVSWEGHFDVTHRERAGTLFKRVGLATCRLHMVSALPCVLLLLTGLITSKYSSAGLHGSEGSSVSRKGVDSFRSIIVRACWPRKCLWLARMPYLAPWTLLREVALLSMLFGIASGKCVGIWVLVVKKCRKSSGCWSWSQLVVLGRGVLTCLLSLRTKWFFLGFWRGGMYEAWPPSFKDACWSTPTSWCCYPGCSEIQGCFQGLREGGWKDDLSLTFCLPDSLFSHLT